MSLNGIFALFGFPEDENGNKELKGEEIKDFKKSATFKIGMFKKLIRNGTLFKKQVVKFLSSSDIGFDVHGIDDAGDYMMFTRAYLWVKDFKFRSKEWKEALFNYSDDEFISLIKLSIKYFEENEEYERCAHLKKIQDLVDKNLEVINSQK